VSSHERRTNRQRGLGGTLRYSLRADGGSVFSLVLPAVEESDRVMAL
jgi:hypothetical protein